ncbi:class I SAM-dependent methyltransferase [Tabrizicola sp. BL-A-41-H6]|uniref:class I SAM-dependent methyltransferase n=1 Tax=Tabrizicola sp. BL-A-41-H6 TaxID=3421107 RepID=UPI003D66969C
MSDLALFRRRLLQNPRQMSAIAPSSRALARAMAKGLGPATGRVVEFGPGTGSLTRAILDAGVSPENLTLFELDPHFAEHLRTAFPGTTLHLTGADTAADHVAAGVGAVVSGLPLLSMPDAVCDAIVSAAFQILAPGAPFIQFTYGPKPPVPADTIAKLGLTVETGPKIWANLPPARVYRFRQI